MSEIELPFRKGSRILELGGGESPIFRPNLDIKPGPSVDIVADLAKDLPIPNDSFDGVYSCFALEHVSWRRTEHMMKEIYRVLRSRGILMLILPNTREQARKVTSSAWDGNESCLLFGDQNYNENYHAAAFCPASTTKSLIGVGFSGVLVYPHPAALTDMVVEAIK